MDTSSCPNHRAIPPDPWMWPSYIQMHTYAHNPWETYGSQTFPTRAATCQLPALSLETLSNPPRMPQHRSALVGEGRDLPPTFPSWAITSHFTLTGAAVLGERQPLTGEGLPPRGSVHTGFPGVQSENAPRAGGGNAAMGWAFRRAPHQRGISKSS